MKRKEISYSRFIPKFISNYIKCEVNTPMKTQRLLECIKQNKIHIYAPYMIQTLNIKHR